MAEQATESQLTQFQFTGFAVNRAVFEHVKRVQPEPGEAKPSELNHNLVVGASISAIGENKAEIHLGMTVQPDPKWMPYKVEVEVIGHFSMVTGTADMFDKFCRLVAPPILFPYIREAIHRLTMDGRYGAVRLNPINMQALLNRTEWQTVPAAASTAASEPSPPSSQ